MKKSSLEIICCSQCKGTLVLKNGVDDGYQVIDSELRCEQCQKTFPVENEIVRFIQMDELEKHDKKYERFRRMFYSHIYDPFTRLEFSICGGEERARHECLDRLEVQPGSRLLETGIGTGSNLPYLVDRLGNGCFFGVDISPSMLHYCLKNLRKWAYPAEIFLARAENLPFKDKVFDSVFHLGAFNIFPDKKRAIEEMIRVARPGTKVVIADETDKANKLLDKLLIPKLLGKKEKVIPPVDLIPVTMTDVLLDTVWKGYGYCLEFRTPA